MLGNLLTSAPFARRQFLFNRASDMRSRFSLVCIVYSSYTHHILIMYASCSAASGTSLENSPRSHFYVRCRWVIGADTEDGEEDEEGMGAAWERFNPVGPDGKCRLRVSPDDMYCNVDSTPFPLDTTRDQRWAFIVLLNSYSALQPAGAHGCRTSCRVCMNIAQVLAQAKRTMCLAKVYGKPTPKHRAGLAFPHCRGMQLPSCCVS